ncbi:hypothetical protein GO594_09605 [Pseudomonas otitidis]|uniref:Uncharacterized protein n=1 Tax=Metapseudomonas otitidis TaxID=319939 RepID=A0A7X3H6D4_9GAMM|nr:hypothetical protein [Pseudomonas otitidis]MWK56228.1 hypothetical protein [Pseudomonas otitidis]
MGKDRRKTPRNQYTPLLSGDVQNAMASHAFERIRHCLLFCFYVELTCDYLNTVYQTNLDPRTAIEDSATHQIDVGYRNKKAQDFDESASSIIGMSITGYKAMDAAHFNNLGLNGSFTSTLFKYSKIDPMVSTLKSYCETMCGNTRLLPKCINIGPDKAVDSAQSKFKNTLFTDEEHPLISGPCISIKSVSHYMTLANSELEKYEKRYESENKLALSLSIKGYIHGFARAGAAEKKRRGNYLINELRDEVQEVVQQVNKHLSQFTSPLPSKITRACRMPGSALKDPQGLFDTRYYLDDSL